MRLLYSALALSLVLLPIHTLAITDEDVAEVTERLESLSTDQLVERKEELEDSLDNDELTEEEVERSVFELSIIEQLLILAGVIIADNISDDTPTPPDTVFPVITILGDNPATVELGSTYTDAGATSDGGETVSSSGTVDTSTVGTYTITYSATDAAGNTSTATRTVNVVDTTAPVFTSSASFSAQENQTSIGTVTATDLQAITFTISGSDILISSSGVLSFVEAPDFETQTSFLATVTATDVSSNSSTQDITVTVTNDESDDAKKTAAPVISTGSAILPMGCLSDSAS